MLCLYVHSIHYQSADLQLCKINNKFGNNVAVDFEWKKWKKWKNKQKLRDNFISNENTSDLSK